MKASQVIPRERANPDVDEIIEHHLGEGAPRAAERFITALERACARIARHPAAGSLRYAHPLNLPGLRVWPLARFPHLIFYIEREDYIDVWRVLHGKRDIPAWLQESDEH